ncbi:UNVERIFIED_CONTAM: internalin A [Acetivibrio alkalicellulosi]
MKSKGKKDVPKIIKELQKIVDERIFESSEETFQEWEWEICKYISDDNGNITHLRLWDVKLNSILEIIFNLISLVSLSLSDTEIVEIPESIIKLTNLQSLFLSDTKIVEIPESITKLTNLQRLDLSYTKIAEIPESITKLTNLQSLDLSDTKIAEIPESITKLTNLQSLDLSGTKIAEIPESITKLTNLQSLFLNGTKIVEIPESITKLTNLQSLFLSDTEIVEIPESIIKLTNLQSLFLRDTKIQEIPESITKLTDLQRLDLSDTEIVEIPESITKLTNLQSLFLNGTKIVEIPESIIKLTNLQSLFLRDTKILEIPESITKLTDLQTLDLRDTKIAEIPESITKLTNLQMLDLSYTKIAEIPESITKLTNLQRLDLSYTKIAEIPESITKLTNLQSLSLSGTKIAEIPESITKLTNLQSLFLSYTEIVEIPESITKLTNLQSLFLSYTEIVEIPESIIKLTNLQSLSLSGTEIVEIPESITKLTNLQSLDLRGTKIIEIPESITKLTNLQRLDLRGTKISVFPIELLDLLLPLKTFEFSNGILIAGLSFTNVPDEIVNQGRKFVENYFKEKKEKLNEFKMIYIGDGAAGKTSLIKRLKDEGFDDKESTTLGVTITDHDFYIDGVKFISHMWDFGGQEIMHSTHKFFLSERCLYVLVLEARKEMKVEYWLKHIELLGGKSPTIVVINKIDTFEQAALDEKFLMDKYNNIKEFCRISCKNGDNIEAVKKSIEKNIKNIDGVEFAWPIKWIGIKEELEKMNKNHISYKEYIDICKKNNVENKEDQDDLLGFLKDMGVICSFSTFPLDVKKVLNPKWITNAVYKIMTDIEVRKLNGYLQKTKVGDIINKDCKSEDYINGYSGINECIYSDDDRNYILNLMEEFELSYSLNETYELIPALMDKSEPDFIFDKDNSLKYVYSYNFLPKSIIHRLIVKNHKIIKENFVWNTGVILCDKDNDSEALIILDEEEKKINIYVDGIVRRDLLTRIRQDLKEINGDFKFSKGDVEESVIKDGFPIEYANILGHYKAGRKYIFIGQTVKEYLVSELLGDIQSLDFTNKEVENHKHENKEEKGGSSMQNIDRTESEKIKTENLGLKTIKIFLASSNELEEDRKEFEIFINRKNKEWVKKKNVFIELIMWEDFIESMSKTRLQDEYNKAIKECDIFIMLFCTKVGKYTAEEFETAFGKFKENDKPFIYTYFKDADTSIGSINRKDMSSLWDFQDKLRELGHFTSNYKDYNELTGRFNNQLEKLYDEYFKV